jgi:hypothetical protein
MPPYFTGNKSNPDVACGILDCFLIYFALRFKCFYKAGNISRRSIFIALGVIKDL